VTLNSDLALFGSASNFFQPVRSLPLKIDLVLSGLSLRLRITMPVPRMAMWPGPEGPDPAFRVRKLRRPPEEIECSILFAVTVTFRSCQPLRPKRLPNSTICPLVAGVVPGTALGDSGDCGASLASGLQPTNNCALLSSFVWNCICSSY